MAYIPPNPNGQATMANSAPVVLASDQGALPFATTDITASSAITIINSVPAGTATAGSAVELTLTGGIGTLVIQTVGTYTGALSLQGTINGTNWITFAGAPLLNVSTGGYLATITSALQSIFQADVAGFAKVRITALAAVTGTVTVSLRGTSSTGMVALDASLPAGANTIGSVGVTSIATSVTPGVGTTNLGKSEDAAAASADTGVFVLGVRRDAAVASTSATGDYSELRVDQFGQLVTTPGVSGTDTITRVASSATTVTLLAASTSRKGAIFYNESTAILYLKYGATASNTSYTVQVAPNATFVLPSPVRQGIIDGIWAAANGAVMVTESI